jgi:hypothetical protein
MRISNRSARLSLLFGNLHIHFFPNKFRLWGYAEDWDGPWHFGLGPLLRISRWMDD